MFFKPAYKSPLVVRETVSVADGSWDTVKLQIDTTERWYIKRVNIYANTGVTIRTEGILFDGEPTEQTESFNTEDVFGDLLVSTQSIEATADSIGNGNGTEDITMELIGFKIRK